MILWLGLVMGFLGIEYSRAWTILGFGLVWGFLGVG